MVNIFLLFWRSHFSHLATLWCSLDFWCNSRKSGSSQSKVCSAGSVTQQGAGSYSMLSWIIDWIFWDSLRACQETNSNPEMQSIKSPQGTFFDHTYQAIHKELTEHQSVFVSLWGVFCVQPHRAAKLSFQVWHCSINSLWGTRSTWKTLQMTLEKWISICSEIGPRVWNRMCLWEIILGPYGFLLCSTLLFRKLTSPSTLCSLQRDMGILWEQTLLGC